MREWIQDHDSAIGFHWGKANLREGRLGGPRDRGQLLSYRRIGARTERLRLETDIEYPEPATKIETGDSMKSNASFQVQTVSHVVATGLNSFRNGFCFDLERNAIPGELGKQG